MRDIDEALENWFEDSEDDLPTREDYLKNLYDDLNSLILNLSTDGETTLEDYLLDGFYLPDSEDKLKQGNMKEIVNEWRVSVEAFRQIVMPEMIKTISFYVE